MQPGIARGRSLFLGPCRFVAGAPSLEGIPPPRLPEVALVGRSNVGKSSLINALTGRKGLARASVTPGRTQHLNFFELGERLMLVDLPGYGFARAPKPVTEAWNATLRAYLRQRPTLKRICLLIDARRGIGKADAPMLALLNEAAVSTLVVLTKADKLSNNALAEVCGQVKRQAEAHAAIYPAIAVTSATTQAGMVEPRALLAEAAT